MHWKLDVRTKAKIPNRPTDMHPLSSPVMPQMQQTHPHPSHSKNKHTFISLNDSCWRFVLSKLQKLAIQFQNLLFCGVFLKAVPRVQDMLNKAVSSYLNIKRTHKGQSVWSRSDLWNQPWIYVLVQKKRSQQGRTALRRVEFNLLCVILEE